VPNQLESGSTISRADAEFIAYRLRGHAKLQRKKLASALPKQLNGELVKKPKAEIAERIRLANALRATSEETCFCQST
jgi:hypothetical protein